MDEKILRIISITVPVFALALIGKLLGRNNIINDESKKGLSWITYHLALPALIFSVFLETDSSKLFTKEIFFLSLLPILTTSIITFMAIFPFKTTSEKKAASIYCSFWGNNGYMGIPLVASAIGNTAGVAIAAVVNGMTVPFYIAIAVFMMIRVKDEKSDEHSIAKEILKTVLNPVIITLIIGSIISFLQIPAYIQNSDTQILKTTFDVVLTLTQKLGSMGLPLALILVGSNLKFSEIKSDKILLSITLVGKLIVAPLTIFLAVKLFFPNLDRDIFVALILLNAVPGAVASYIISSRYNCAEDFVSSLLVISTALSVITIPVWLYFVM